MARWHRELFLVVANVMSVFSPLPAFVMNLLSSVRAYVLLNLRQGTGAMKAAEALASFTNITHGFAAMLVGDCFEDVSITSVTLSQYSVPLPRRVPSRDTSSTSYLDAMAPEEAVPSAIGLSVDDTTARRWFVVFMVIVLLSIGVFTAGGGRVLLSTGGKWSDAVVDARGIGGTADNEGNYAATSRNATTSMYSRGNRCDI